MTPKDIERWLESGDIDGETNPGAASLETTQLILELRRKRKPELSDEDFAQMRKVVGQVHRHTPDAPTDEPELGRWRRTLMSWGHDPLKKSRY